MRIRRVLVNALIRSVIPAVIGLVIWVGGYMLLMSFLMSGPSSGLGRQVYKNYREEPLVAEILADKETVEKSPPVAGTFVVIPISGEISSGLYQDVYDQLYIAGRLTKDVKAIIFVVDSPGGGVTPSDELYEEVRIFRTRGYKVVTYVNSMSASGAYYITSNSDKIVASPTSLVGSIGVIMEWYNFEGLAGKLGVSQETIKSSAMKDIGSPFKKMSDKERTVLQKLVDQSYIRFKSIVKTGRKFTDSEVNRVATGEIWTAQDAQELGLVDDVGYLSKAISITKQITGVNTPTILTYQKEYGLLEMFGVKLPLMDLVNNLNRQVSKPQVLGPQLLYKWIP